MSHYITRLQLLESEVKGFLDIEGDTSVPINLGVSDIRDVDSRTGMFSKTITLSGTKNNNELLNNYYDVNIVAGTFDLNKRQKVAIVENGTIIRDNCFMRLLKIGKTQATDSNVDEYVSYEVQVQDELGDFFKEINNKEVTDLIGWEQFNHAYNVTNITNSFSHTVDDGYKYVLPWIADDEFHINELLPAIYAKQIFDRIHKQNGFSYVWDELDEDDFRFDKVLIPYAGDIKKLSDDYIKTNTVKADKVTAQSTVTSSLGNSTIYGSIPTYDVVVDNETQDIGGKYNPTTSVYSNTSVINTPSFLNYHIVVDYDLVLVNDNAFDVQLSGGACIFSNSLSIFDIFTGTVKNTVNLPVVPNTSLAPVNYFLSSNDYQIQVGFPYTYAWTPGDHIIASGTSNLNIPVTSLLGTDLLRINTDTDLFYITSSGAVEWREFGTFTPADMKVKFVINSIRIEISNSANSPLFVGADIRLQDFLPLKIKQKDFLKSVYNKYNLYVEIDPENPSRLIYTSRNKFYDTGTLKDWTYKLNKEKEQELYFIPDITTKSMILSDKDDSKDFLLESYLGETSKTFGQVRVTFDNENVRGEERKETIFSPTVSMVTSFGAVLPALPADFKMNIRYLLDGGELSCNSYFIKESDSATYFPNTYPHVSMFDRPYNPQFSLEYALSDYYAYNPGMITQNNLYNLHWRRTLAQINSGKMLKAYFWLNEIDIQGLKMNDLIKVNNAIYYINKVIDYNANAYAPTLVELLTVEDDLILPTVGGGIAVSLTENPSGGITTPYVPTSSTEFFTEAVGHYIDKRNDTSVLATTPASLKGNFGMNNILPSGFKGVVIGDNISPTDNGLYIGEKTAISELKLTTPYVETKDLKVGASKYTGDGIQYRSTYVEDGYIGDGYFEVRTANTGYKYDQETDKLTYSIEADQTLIANPVFSSGSAPTSTSDTSGTVGEYRFDDDYVYIKTTIGWQRIRLNTF